MHDKIEILIKNLTVILVLILIFSTLPNSQVKSKLNYSKDPHPKINTDSQIALFLNSSQIYRGATLATVIQNVLKSAQGSYGVAISNLQSKETFYLNEHNFFETGSLYKLWVMATTYQQIQQRKLTEDQILSENANTLNQEFNIDPQSAEQTAGNITLTVSDALDQMITISDNYSALLLSSKITLAAIEDFLKTNGFFESKVSNDQLPVSTPLDISRFLEKLYKGELANKKYTQKMLTLLKNQQLRKGLPKDLPSYIEVANKTGEIDSFKHDAGIVYTATGDYIVVIMSDSDSPNDAQEEIAMISKAVFDYFTNKQNASIFGFKPLFQNIN